MRGEVPQEGAPATGKVPFALLIPSNAPNVVVHPEEMHGKERTEEAFLERNPWLKKTEIRCKDTYTTIEDVTSTSAGETSVRDGNETKTMPDFKQDLGSKSVWDRDDD